MRKRWTVLVLGLAAVTACGGGTTELGEDEQGRLVTRTSSGALEGLWADEAAGGGRLPWCGVRETPGRRPTLASSRFGGALGRNENGDRFRAGLLAGC